MRGLTAAVRAAFLIFKAKRLPLTRVPWWWREAHKPPNYRAGIHFKQGPLTPVETLAKHDVVVIRDWQLFHAYPGLVDKIHALNPRCRVLGYLAVWHIVCHVWEITSYPSVVDRMAWDDYRAVFDYLWRDGGGAVYSAWGGSHKPEPVKAPASISHISARPEPLCSPMVRIAPRPWRPPWGSWMSPSP